MRRIVRPWYTRRYPLYNHKGDTSQVQANQGGNRAMPQPPIESCATLMPAHFVQGNAGARPAVNSAGHNPAPGSRPSRLFRWRFDDRDPTAQEDPLNQSGLSLSVQPSGGREFLTTGSGKEPCKEFFQPYSVGSGKQTARNERKSRSAGHEKHAYGSDQH